MATKLDNDLTVESVSRMVSPDRPDTKGVTAGNFIIVARKLGFTKKEIREMLEHVMRERPDTRQKELLSLLF
jgi:DNA-binding transcriptional regulator YhcF (GntR family)